jgi:hypothetical protein
MKGLSKPQLLVEVYTIWQYFSFEDFRKYFTERGMRISPTFNNKRVWELRIAAIRTHT